MTNDDVTAYELLTTDIGEGMYPVHLAARLGDFEMAYLLTPKRSIGPYANIIIDPTILRDSSGKTAWHYFAETGQSDAVAYFDGDISRVYHKRAYCSATDNLGNTLLHVAAQNGHLDFVKAMILLCVSRTIKNDAGLTPLDLAALAGHHAVVKELAESPRRSKQYFYEKIFGDGAYLLNNGDSALSYAAITGNVNKMARLLISSSVLTNDERADFAKSLIHGAFKYGHASAVLFLARHGADDREVKMEAFRVALRAIENNPASTHAEAAVTTIKTLAFDRRLAAMNAWKEAHPR
ncbi:MAG: ankyrin repeat domain-containing protein [Gammaproteobacteria bacterium]|nr:ankyrin repeat domain-containing protein [Gammaproteobacteria bacterium]